jgi:hypothetical protein
LPMKPVPIRPILIWSMAAFDLVRGMREAGR